MYSMAWLFRVSVCMQDGSVSVSLKVGKRLQAVVKEDREIFYAAFSFGSRRS